MDKIAKRYRSHDLQRTFQHHHLLGDLLDAAGCSAIASTFSAIAVYFWVFTLQPMMINGSIHVITKSQCSTFLCEAFWISFTIFFCMNVVWICFCAVIRQDKMR